MDIDPSSKIGDCEIFVNLRLAFVSSSNDSPASAAAPRCLGSCPRSRCPPPGRGWRPGPRSPSSAGARRPTRAGSAPTSTMSRCRAGAHTGGFFNCMLSKGGGNSWRRVFCLLRAPGRGRGVCAGAQHVSGEGHVSRVTCHVSTQGDSGGSVLTSAPGSEGEEVWSLAGVVSFGSSLGCEVGTWSPLTVSGEAVLSVLQVDFPNGLTRVEHYLDWIQYETGTGAWVVNINFLESFIKINDSDYILPASIMSVNVLMGLIQHQPQLFPVAKII